MISKFAFEMLLLGILLWEGVWKSIALWYAAKNNKKAWFIALAIIASVGILPIIYLIFFRKSREDAEIVDKEDDIGMSLKEIEKRIKDVDKGKVVSIKEAKEKVFTEQPSPRLVEYVKSVRKHGIDDEKIRKSLIKAGWKKETVDLALK